MGGGGGRGGHVTNSVSGPSLSSSEVSSIICAQVLHSLSSASPRHPADRCYLRCYYPSSNKTTLLSSCFRLSGITSPQCFFHFAINSQRRLEFAQTGDGFLASGGVLNAKKDFCVCVCAKFQQIKKTLGRPTEAIVLVAAAAVQFPYWLFAACHPPSLSPLFLLLSAYPVTLTCKEKEN